MDYYSINDKNLNSRYHCSESMSMLCQILLQLIFLAITLSSLEGETCFQNGTSWSDEFLQDISLHIPTALACLNLCALTPGCIAFTWLSQNNSDHHLAESCLIFTDIGTPEACEECISGQLADCQLCSHPVSCEIGEENLIDTAPVATEIECKIMCADTAGCEYYTWFENSTIFRKVCFLLSSCEDKVDCVGCSSGPPSCQGEYCEGIEYKELDDPTRSEKHGK